jgi:hypothetical protein
VNEKQHRRRKHAGIETLAAGILLSLGVVAIAYVCGSMLGMNFGGKVLSHEELSAIAREEGQTLVRALWAYHRVHGTYPQHLKDIAPDFVAELPERAWVFDSAGYLRYKFNWDESIAFVFDPGHENHGWHVFSPTRGGPLGLDPPASAPSSPGISHGGPTPRPR